MDKNTITGFVLIAAIVIGFSILNRPSEAELAQARQQQVNDSIRQARSIAEAEKQIQFEDSLQNQQKKEDKVNSFFQVKDAQNQQQAELQQGDSIRNVTGRFTADEANDLANALKRGADAQLAEQTISLENSLLKIDISTKGAQMTSAQLKNYTDYNGDPLYLFNNDSDFSLELENKSSVKLNTRDAYFEPVATGDSLSATLRLHYDENQYIDFLYTLSPDSYVVDFDILAVGMDDILSRDSKERFILSWQQALKRKEKSVENEQRYSRIYYKHTGADVNDLSDSKEEKVEIPDPVKWVAFKTQFFASAIIADESFDISVLNTRKLESQDVLKHYSASLYITPLKTSDNSLKTGFRFFLGPLEYPLLTSLDDGIDNASEQLDLNKVIPLGWWIFRLINQYFIIPLFTLLCSTGFSVGIVILLLTLIVKLIISPLTYKSYMSSAKMRVLRPQVEKVNEKFKQDQAVERQRATMELYRQAGVNPMSGCIPMLLQMPILLALFSFFPSAIELRHQSFLWATDLSTYDAILEWKGNIPIISSVLGNHLSLFCILMTATNIVYTKFNMDATNTGQQQMPGMKWMMYLMPLIFLFVLNNYPSGLTYYYFISTLITILLTLTFRWVIDENKVLAKLEENKKKPKKKSGFMARLEEAQKLQQQQARGKKKK